GHPWKVLGGHWELAVSEEARRGLMDRGGADQELRDSDRGGRPHPVGNLPSTPGKGSCVPDSGRGNSWEPVSCVEGIWIRAESLASGCGPGGRDCGLRCPGVCSPGPDRGGRIRALHGRMVSVSSGGTRLPSLVPGSVQRRRCIDMDGILDPHHRRVRMGRKETEDFPRSRRGLRCCGLGRSPSETLTDSSRSNTCCRLRVPMARKEV